MLTQKTDDIAVSHREVFDLAKQDLDFFASLALPLITQYEYPQIFHAIWHMLLNYAERDRDFSKLAVGIPRGFAKTSLVKLLILYCIIYTDKSFFLVLASTATHAQNIIADIADMLDEPNIANTFGDWRSALETDNRELKKFGFRGRDVILAALGQGGSVRGINIKHRRPDLMLFDDIQTREDTESELVSNAIYTWMLGTAMKTASHSGCLYIFLGNMYPGNNSILRKLKDNPEWIKVIVGGITADGNSLWEELKPLKQLLAEARNDYASGHPEIFHAEVLNDESASLNNNIDISKIPPYPFDDNEISAGNFIIIDPSNDKHNSDSVTITANAIYDGKPVVLKINEGRYSPEQIIKETLKMAMRHSVSLIAVEANAYQYSLLFWFNKYIQMLSMYGLQVKPIYSGSRSKNSRILDMFKSLLAGEILIHPNCAALAYNQITNFNPLKTNNVDGILDCITYVPKVLSEYSNLIAINSTIVQTSATSDVWPEELNCIF